MLQRFTATLLAFACLSAPVLGAQSCAPEKLSAAIVTYARDPFSPRSWRVLKGLGDPGIEQGYGGFGDTWQQQQDWANLVKQISPDDKTLTDVGYECRIGYPLQVLKERVSTLGRESKYVRQWLSVQGKVLQACSEPNSTDLSIPDPIQIHPALARMQADDRAYQQASVAFYRDKAKAIDEFKAIGASESEHRAAARYNVANLLANSKQLDAARAEANAILADPGLASVHAITRELLGYIANLADTAEGWTALINRTIATIEQPVADITRTPQAQAEYANALYDLGFAGVRGKDDDWWLDGKLPENPTISKALVDASRQHPIALWIMAGQSANQAYRAGPWSLAGDKWLNRMAEIIGKAEAIKPAADGIPAPARAMLDALTARPDDATRGKLWDEAHAAMAAAEQSCGSDPQTAAAGLLLAHAVRVSAQSGHAAEAIAELEKVPFKSASAYYDGALGGLAQLLLGQGDLVNARLLRDRLLTPAFFAGLPEDGRQQTQDTFSNFMGWIAEDEAHWKQALALSSAKTANTLLNFQPAEALWTLADDPMFSDADKALLGRAAWTRGYARGITQSEAQTAKLFALNPELKAAADKAAQDYPSASVERQRLLTILRNPRYGILVNAPGIMMGGDDANTDFSALDSYDPNDKNWWCPFNMNRQLGGLRTSFDEALGTADYDSYGNRDLKPVYDDAVRAKVDAAREVILKSHPLVKTIDWKEMTALGSMGSAPRTLTQSAIRWGKASKGGDGAPEALALAVRATRYGCRWDGSHESFSKPAQELLKAKFGETQWAKETPYWFGCVDQQWDKDGNRVSVCAPRQWPKQASLK